MSSPRSNRRMTNGKRGRNSVASLCLNISVRAAERRLFFRWNWIDLARFIVRTVLNLSVRNDRRGRIAKKKKVRRDQQGRLRLRPKSVKGTWSHAKVMSRRFLSLRWLPKSLLNQQEMFQPWTFLHLMNHLWLRSLQVSVFQARPNGNENERKSLVQDHPCLPLHRAQVLRLRRQRCRHGNRHRMMGSFRGNIHCHCEPCSSERVKQSYT